MQTLAILLVAAATTGQTFGKPHVGGMKLFRHNAVVEAPAPPGGPMVMPPGGMGGAGGAAGQPGRRFPNVRSQIIFLDPVRMNIAWQTAVGPDGSKAYASGVTVPASYNFLQGYIYRLKLTDVPNRGDRVLYPTIEVAPSTPATDAYLTHNAIPVQFTAEDFDQVVDGGNFVTKVIYLPDPKYQELAIAGVETLVSTRLEPGVDPIIEADKRGTILLIVRLGGINLEMQGGPTGPAMAVPAVESIPLETAPGSIAPPVTMPMPMRAPAPSAIPAPDVAPPTAIPTPKPPVVNPLPAPEAVLSLPAPDASPALEPVPAIEPPLPLPASPSL